MPKQPSFHTVTEVAALIGVTPARIRVICREHNIGSLVSGRLRVLTRTDVERLKTIHGKQRKYEKQR